MTLKLIFLVYNFWRKACSNHRNTTNSAVRLIRSSEPLIRGLKTATGIGKMKIILILRVDLSSSQATLVHIVWMHLLWLYIQSGTHHHFLK